MSRGSWPAQPRQRSPAGLADIAVRMAVNLYGARAMTPRSSPPTSRPRSWASVWLLACRSATTTRRCAINIGTNRWAFKPELGVSHRTGPWTFEGDLGHGVLHGQHELLQWRALRAGPDRRHQGHVIRTFKPGLWAAVDANFWRGGRPTVNGTPGSELQKNSRVGATLAMPIARQQQLRVAFSFGAYTRLGGDFKALGVSYSYVWR